MKIVPILRIAKAASGGIIVGRTSTGKAIHEAGHEHTSAAWKAEHGFSYNDDHKEACAHHDALAKKHNERGDHFHSRAERLAAVPKDHPALKGQERDKDVEALRKMAGKHWDKAKHHDEQAQAHKRELSDRKDRRKARKAK